MKKTLFLLFCVIFLTACSNKQDFSQTEIDKSSIKKEFEEYQTKVLPIIAQCDNAYDIAVKGQTKELFQNSENVCYASSLQIIDIPFDIEKEKEAEWDNDENKVPAFAPLRYKIFDMLQEKSNVSKIAKNTMEINSKYYSESDRLIKYNQLKKSVEESFEYYNNL